MIKSCKLSMSVFAALVTTVESFMLTFQNCYLKSEIRISHILSHGLSEVFAVFNEIIVYVQKRK